MLQDWALKLGLLTWQCMAQRGICCPDNGLAESTRLVQWTECCLRKTRVCYCKLTFGFLQSATSGRVWRAGLEARIELSKVHPHLPHYPPSGGAPTAAGSLQNDEPTNLKIQLASIPPQGKFSDRFILTLVAD